jgi:hypothetical protein
MMYNMVVLNSFVIYFAFMREEFLTRRREKTKPVLVFLRVFAASREYVFWFRQLSGLG